MYQVFKFLIRKDKGFPGNIYMEWIEIQGSYFIWELFLFYDSPLGVCTDKGKFQHKNTLLCDFCLRSINKRLPPAGPSFKCCTELTY